MKKILSCLLLITYLSFASEDVDNTINPPLPQKKLEPQSLLQSSNNNPWVHSVGLINVYFGDGTLSQGFGALLKDGFFITSADLVFKNGYFPNKIDVKMQDDSAKPLICIANLEVKAIDEEKGLALLKTQNFTDEYCHIRSESFYHKRIYELYYLDIFSHRVPMNIAYDISKQDIQKKLFFPTILKQYSFDTQSIESEKRLFYFDPQREKNLFYALGIEKNSNIKIGNPFFDEQGNLIGIYTQTKYYRDPVIIHENIIKSFLCNLQANFKLDTWNKKDCKLFQDNLIENIKDIVQDADTQSRSH